MFFFFFQLHEYHKQEPCTQLFCFLSYGIKHKGYKCQDFISKIIHVSRHIVFLEHKMFSLMYHLNYIPFTDQLFFINNMVDLFFDEPPLSLDTFETHIGGTQITRVVFLELSSSYRRFVINIINSFTLHHSTQVKKLLDKLRDFQGLAIIILYKP